MPSNSETDTGKQAAGAFELREDGRTAEILWGASAVRELVQNPKALELLVRCEVADTYDTPSIVAAGIRSKIYDCIAPVNAVVGKMSSGLQRVTTAPLADAVYPDGWTQGDEVKWTLQDAQKIVDTGNIAIAKVNGKIVSLAACKEGELPNGASFYEMTKLVTLPEFRKKGLNGVLCKQVLTEMQERHPDGVKMSCTKAPAEIHRCKELGWQEIDMDRYLLLQRLAGKEWTPEMIERSEGQGWRAFLNDPDGAVDDILGTEIYSAQRNPIRNFQLPEELRDSPQFQEQMRRMPPDKQRELVEQIGVDEYLRRAQFLVPIGTIQHVLRRYCEDHQQEVPRELNPEALQNFDPNSPLFEWVNDTTDFAINHHRYAYESVKGEQFVGSNNMGMVIEKTDNEGKPFEQVVMLVCNHGEVAAPVKWLHSHGFFGDPTKPVRMVQWDGHADATGADNAPVIDEEQKQLVDQSSLFEEATVNDQENSIASYNTSLIEKGVLDPRHVYLKSNADSWSDADADSCFYHMHYRFSGARGCMELDIEPENGIVTDRQMHEVPVDWSNGDMDMHYYEQEPRTIAWSIRKKAAFDNNAPLVTLTPSPGWMDQELAMLHCQINAELLYPQKNRDRIRRYVEQLYERMQQLGRENVANDTNPDTRSGSPLYQNYATVTDAQRDNDIEEMLSILLVEDVEFRREVDPNQFEVSYYNEPKGTYEELIRQERVAVGLELQHKLLPSLARSPYARIQALSGEFESAIATTDNVLLEREGALPDDVREQACKEKKNTAPVDYAITKIVRNLRDHFIEMSEDEVVNDLRMLLGILKANDITERPIAIQREILEFCNIFGMETGLWDYEYSSHQNQPKNWASRMASINGQIADRAATDSVLTMHEVSSVLDVAGGGHVTVTLEENDNAENTKPFVLSYGMNDPRRQAAAEILAHMYVNGHVWQDKNGHVMLPINGEIDEEWVRWNVTDKNTNLTDRIGTMHNTAQQWTPATSATSSESDEWQDTQNLLRAFSGAILNIRKTISLPTYDLHTEKDVHQELRPVLALGEQCYQAVQSWDYNTALSSLDTFLNSIQAVSIENTDHSAMEAIQRLQQFCSEHGDDLTQSIQQIRSIQIDALQADMINFPPKSEIMRQKLETLEQRRAFLKYSIAGTTAAGLFYLLATQTGGDKRDYVDNTTPLEWGMQPIQLTPAAGILPVIDPAWKVDPNLADDPEGELYDVIDLLHQSPFMSAAKYFYQICDASQEGHSPAAGGEGRGSSHEHTLSLMLSYYHLARERLGQDDDLVRELNYAVEDILEDVYKERQRHPESTKPHQALQLFRKYYDYFRARQQKKIERDDSEQEVLRNYNPLGRLPDTDTDEYFKRNKYLHR